ncbi:MAG: RNA polymerase factor sigma-54 [Campylobacterota bacterium]|nr:RNA polymerase factor sigma-54 [Campylobacterota bacterium]
MLRVKQQVENKTKLSNTMRNWLPILHSSLSDLGEVITPFVESNPLIEIKSGFEENFEKRIPKKIFTDRVSNSRTEQIEALTIFKRSLFDILDEQMGKPLFPTPLSQEIAQHIIENLDEGGYYEGDTQKFCHINTITEEQFYKVHQRFLHVEPVGIGARNLKESFLFQLDSCEISDEAYTLATKMIENLERMHTFSKELHFQEAMKEIGRFKNPPAIDYMEDSTQIIPDIVIYFNEDEGIEVKLNDAYYPSIDIDYEYGVDHEYVKEKIKEAKNLVDALDMRRATLYKVGLMIVEYQYDFFTGGNIMPMTLKMLADEFGHNPSTISRAIANKYIACDRGTLPMKDFFTTAIDDDVSNAAIKEFLLSIIKNEPRHKTLSDMKILAMIQEKFKIKMVRRTIAKYRKQLNIAGSSERKKNYQLECS